LEKEKGAGHEESKGPKLGSIHQSGVSGTFLDECEVSFGAQSQGRMPRGAICPGFWRKVAPFCPRVLKKYLPEVFENLF
jgi:hypothetical protein